MNRTEQNVIKGGKLFDRICDGLCNEEIEYITIDVEDLEPVNSFFVEVNRDYNSGDPPHQEVGGSSQDDSTLGVITIEDFDRGNQENDDLEMEVLIQADDSFIEKVNTDYSSGDPQQLCQEGGGSITIDDSFMEDANRDYDSHSNTQDDSNDSPLNDTITITDDPTVDNSQEEHEVIDLTTSPADSQVSSVLSIKFNSRQERDETRATK